MSDFIRFVLSELQSILILLVLAGFLAAVVIGGIYLIFRKKYRGERKFPWVRIVLYLLFAGYLFMVLSATILRKTGGFHREYNLHLFRAWLEAWNNFSVKNWANVLLNVAMFIPLGVFLPVLWRKCRNWFISIPIGFGTSLIIELIQLVISRGICDVDDLFANTLGAVIGFWLIMALLSLFREKGERVRPCLLYSAFSLVPVLAICAVFIAYHFQEYGNLANAPAYINYTKGLSWKLDCELPAAEDTVAAYKTQTYSTAQCDAFAKQMAENMGLIVDLTTYYQEYAYYNLRPGGILMVYYHDGSYEFMSAAHWEQTNWTEADRPLIEKALADYPVHIPAAAEFYYEGDGWHNFTVCRYMDGALMYDGTLRARYADNGNVEEVENYLSAYTFYEKVSIISAEQAFDRLKAGCFNDGGYFEHVKPSEITVTECVLDYQVDTKGFYQPVYIFSMEATDGSYDYSVMIPAMK